MLAKPDPEPDEPPARNDGGLVYLHIERIVGFLEAVDEQKKQLYSDASSAGLDKPALSRAVGEVRKARKDKSHSLRSFEVSSALTVEYIEAYLQEEATRFGDT